MLLTFQPREDQFHVIDLLKGVLKIDRMDAVGMCSKTLLGSREKFNRQNIALARV